MNEFNTRNIQRNDSLTLLTSDLKLPPISDAQAATILFLAMQPEKAGDERNEELSKLIEKFGSAINEGSLEKIRKALTIKLFKIKASPPVTNNRKDRQAVLDSNFSEIDDVISEEEEEVLQCYEIFRLLSINPIPPFLVEYFDKIVADKNIPVRRDSNSDDFKTFFVYTENNILREVCEFLSPKDVARLFDTICNDKCTQEISMVLNKVALSEGQLHTVEGLKEAAFYYMIFLMIQEKMINRLYTHELKCIVETVQAKYESEGSSNVSRFEESIVKLKRYPVSSHPPGICLIFIMGINRTGYDNDVEAVKNLFEKIYRYDVILKSNPSKEVIETVINKLKAPRNKFYDSLVVWFMGHGNHKFLQVNDGQIDRRKEFIEPLTKIKWFNKKPKLFFIQACNVEENGSSGRELSRNISAMKTDTDASAIGLGTGQHWNDTYASFMEFESVNHYADTLIANAANRDAYASRNEEGSLWVQTLTDLLGKWGHKESIENVLRIAHYNVNTISLATEDKEWKQTPFYESSLQKEFIFPRNGKILKD